jgi:PEP-CTERM motif-containing protein
MKITNWRRKLLAACAAGGLIVPTAVNAANLGVNLVTNGDFENVNVNITGAYHAPLVLNWTGPNLFAYSHDGSTTPPAFVVPDYAEGADPPGAGHWYFTPNNTGVADPTDVHDPNVFFQDIDVSAGATAAAIANGSATYALSAYMTSYLNDTDVAHARAEFRNSVSAVIGSAQIDDSDPGPNNVWNLNFTNGLVPLGTTSVRLSLWGTRTAGGAGADGYMDNVDFTIRGVIPEPSSVILAGMGLAAVGGSLTRRRKGS